MISFPLSIASGGSLVDLDGTFWIQLGIFFIMFLFLHFALVKPVTRLMAARHEATVGKTDKAHLLKSDAAALAQEIDAKFSAVRAEAVTEHRRVIDGARQREREVLSSAQDNARTEIGSARGLMQESAATVRQQLQNELSVLADAVAARMIKRMG